MYPVSQLVDVRLSPVFCCYNVLKSIKFESASARVLEGSSSETQKVETTRPMKGTPFQMCEQGSGAIRGC